MLTVIILIVKSRYLVKGERKVTGTDRVKSHEYF